MGACVQEFLDAAFARGAAGEAQPRQVPQRPSTRGAPEALSLTQRTPRTMNE